MMLKITSDLIDDVSREARRRSRRRCNYNFHKADADPMQRFLNALEPRTYVRPHKHSVGERREIFLILRGSVLMVEFNDHGAIVDHVILDACDGARGAEMSPESWHSLIALKDGSVLYEIKDGPYNPETDKTYAEWSPEEGSQEGGDFNMRILTQLEIPYRLV